MTSAFRSLLWYLLVGTRGGPNRIRILEELRQRPYNAHQLAEALGVDYRTVRHHLVLLERCSVYRQLWLQQNRHLQAPGNQRGTGPAPVLAQGD